MSQDFNDPIPMPGITTGMRNHTSYRNVFEALRGKDIVWNQRGQDLLDHQSRSDIMHNIEQGLLVGLGLPQASLPAGAMINAGKFARFALSIECLARYMTGDKDDILDIIFAVNESHISQMEHDGAVYLNAFTLLIENYDIIRERTKDLHPDDMLVLEDIEQHFADRYRPFRNKIDTLVELLKHVESKGEAEIDAENVSLFLPHFQCGFDLLPRLYNNALKHSETAPHLIEFERVVMEFLVQRFPAGVSMLLHYYNGLVNEYMPKLRVKKDSMPDTSSEG